MLSSKCHERGQKANEKAKSRYLCDARADFIYINIGKIIAYMCFYFSKISWAVFEIRVARSFVVDNKESHTSSIASLV